MSEIPLVSICIPAYNAEKYIEDTITSLLNQTYKNIEIIIVDDSSSDSTFIKCSKFINNGIKVYNNEKKGAASARNVAFKNSLGDFIVFFDADDIVESDFIQTQYSIIENDLDCCVVSAWGRFEGRIENFKEDIFCIKRDMSFEEWVIGYWTNCRHTTPPGRIMASRMLINKTDLWDESLSLNDDFQFYSRLFYESKLIKYNPKSFFKYRTGVGGLSTKKNDYNYQFSNFKSLMSGISLAVSISNDPKVKIACANMLQNFIYECYPDYIELVEKAENKIKEFGGSSFPITVRKPLNLIVKIIGWKNWYNIKYKFIK